MNTKAGIIVTVCCAFSVLLLLGFWVGAFETFGGYVARKRTFLLASVTIGLFVAWLIHRKWKVHYALAGAFFVLSHFAYVLGQAFGETYYEAPTDAGGFVRSLFHALNDQL